MPGNVEKTLTIALRLPCIGYEISAQDWNARSKCMEKVQREFTELANSPSDGVFSHGTHIATLCCSLPMYLEITHPVHIGYFFGESLKFETSTDPDSRYVLMLLEQVLL